MAKENNSEPKKIKDPNKKSYFDKWNLKKLTNEISTYGFKYSTREFVFQAAIILGVVFGAAWISDISPQNIFILMTIALFATPIIVTAWFKRLYNTKRFSYVTDYLTNIVPIFMQHSKIRTSLIEVSDLVSGKMKTVVIKAINYIDNPPKNAKNIDREALEIIENEFPNTRIKSVHKMMMTIEGENSRNFTETCENMFQDVEAWVRRVYIYQADLKSRQSKLLILCGLSLGMNCMFTFMYSSNEYFQGFTDTGGYQIMGMIFISLLLVVISFVLTKLHGEWLVNDSTNKEIEANIRAYKIVNDPNIRNYKPVNIVFAVILMGIAFWTFAENNFPVALVFLMLATSIAFQQKMKIKAARKRIQRAFQIEFPIWLRDISLNLSTSTVVNAVEKSLDNASWYFRNELIKFLNQVYENPNSIKPYNDFLAMYDLQDARSSMKVLFSLNNMGEAQVRNQISSLILRNQDMLAKSEELQNEDSLSMVEMVGYMPILLLTFSSMVNMFMLFGFVFSQLQEMMGAMEF